MTAAGWIIAVLGLIVGPAVTLLISRRGQKLDRSKMLTDLQDSIMETLQEERATDRAELKELRAEVKGLREEVRAAHERAAAAEARADGMAAQISHFDSEVQDLRNGVESGRYPPLPDRPLFHGHA